MQNNLSRRSLLKVAAGTAALPYLAGNLAFAAADAFQLPALPWPRDALAPLISQETIDFHYGKHHAAYVQNLNKLVKGTEFDGKDLEHVVKTAPPGPIFNNAAQVWNHTFFWNCLSPKGGGEPAGKVAEAIDKGFGSFASFKEKFTDAAVKLFGSGWAWLARQADGSLVIQPLSNADTPLKTGATPLLTCDVWEHAYYIDYRNRRPEFVAAFWKLVDWKAVAGRL